MMDFDLLVIDEWDFAVSIREEDLRSCLHRRSIAQ